MTKTIIADVSMMVAIVVVILSKGQVNTNIARVVNA
jgi:hypothetical protein